jgi:serine/threonine-protein kinase
VLVGAVIDRRFRVDRVVGPGERGGVVLNAFDTTTGSPVAIRCPGIPEGLDGPSYEAALDAFVREAELLSRACASGGDVERLLTFGVARKVPYCIYEWLEGKSLEQHIMERGGRAQSMGEALTLLEPAARALSAAHAVGVSHKDVRPRNLWLSFGDGRMRLKLTQFVLASRIGGAEDAFDPQYAAPEHFKRSYGSVGPASDVYGFALCLIELVSGQRALDGEDPAELYLATSDIIRRPSLRSRGVEVGAAVEAVLARALAVEPKRRWQNAQEMWDALIAAVPELTPAAPSIRPPEATGSSKSVSPSVAAVEDARLVDSVRDLSPVPPPREPTLARGRALPWLLFAAAIAGSIIIIALRLGAQRPQAKPVATPTQSDAAVRAQPGENARAP